MRRWDEVLLLVPLVLAACDEQPWEPTLPSEDVPLAQSEPSAAVVASTFTCMRSWASGVDGDWHDAGSWTPQGVPAESDSVCIDAAGSYTVQLDTTVLVAGLYIGGPSGVATLEIDGPGGIDLLISGDLIIGQTGRLDLQSESWLSVGSSPPGIFPQFVARRFENHGVLDVTDQCSCGSVATLDFKYFVNYGWMFLTGPMQIWIRDENMYIGSFLNRGFIMTQGSDTVEVRGIGGVYDRPFEHQSGTIAGSVPFYLSGGFPHNLSFIWSGGTLPTNTADPSSPVLIADVADITLANTGLSGHVEMRNAYHVYGNIGAGVRLKIVPETSVWTEFSPSDQWPPDPNMGPVVNRGTVEISLDSYDIVDLNFPSWFVNRGTLEVLGDGEVEIETDSIINRGSMTVEGTLSVEDDPLSGNGVRLRNADTITVVSGGSLEVVDGTFGTTPTSVMTGRLELDNATLQGNGRVGQVISHGGTIRPGYPDIGTLTAGSVILDSTSELVIEIADANPGSYDQLVINGNVTYAGTLTIVGMPPFTGGWCGQVVPIITDKSKSTVPRGAFATFNGLSQGASNAWRIYNPQDSYQLVGYDIGAGAAFVSASSLALAEGGVTERYHICLGSKAPKSDVTVLPAPVQGQISHSRPVTFDMASWLLPRPVTVTAINDVVIEPPHADTVEHTIKSADPAYGSASVASVPVTITDNDGSADLQFALVSAPSVVTTGDVFNAIYTVTNNGPTLSTGATTVSVPLAGVAYVSSAGDIACTLDVDVLNCIVPSRTPGGVADLNLTLQAITVGSHTNTMTVTGHQPDPNAGNDTVVYNLTVS